MGRRKWDQFPKGLLAGLSSFPCGRPYYCGLSLVCFTTGRRSLFKIKELALGPVHHLLLLWPSLIPGARPP